MWVPYKVSCWGLTNRTFIPELDTYWYPVYSDPNAGWPVGTACSSCLQSNRHATGFTNMCSPPPCVHYHCFPALYPASGDGTTDYYRYRSYDDVECSKPLSGYYYVDYIIGYTGAYEQLDGVTGCFLPTTINFNIQGGNGTSTYCTLNPCSSCVIYVCYQKACTHTDATKYFQINIVPYRLWRWSRPCWRYKDSGGLQWYYMTREPMTTLPTWDEVQIGNITALIYTYEAWDCYYADWACVPIGPGTACDSCFYCWECWGTEEIFIPCWCYHAILPYRIYDKNIMLAMEGLAKGSPILRHMVYDRAVRANLEAIAFGIATKKRRADIVLPYPLTRSCHGNIDSNFKELRDSFPDFQGY
jgi:hypothetical protein